MGRSLLIIFAAVAAMLPFAQATGPSFEIFAMDNGVGRGSWTPERQASTLRDIGFDGISYNYTTPADLKAWIAELAKRNLKLFGICFAVRLDGDNPFPAGVEEAVNLLRGTGAVLWVNIPSPESPGDYEAIALKRVQETADLAATMRLRVVLYPHRNQYVETAEHAFALVARSGRANVGVTVNLCHELGAGNGVRLPEIIRRVAPSLAMVSINGAAAKLGQGWDNQNYIKLLGTGDYDVAAILRTLAEVKYFGPIGVQYYALKGDPRENLEASMRAWRRLNKAVTPL
jgi:sugar phosphate isomerase/epimerase